MAYDTKEIGYIDREAEYTIVQAQLPVVKWGGHNYIAVLDSNKILLLNCMVCY